MNERIENIGARRLTTVIERTLEEVSFQATELANTTVVVDAAYVQVRTAGLIEDTDLSRFIL